jgi:hypothetical protein
MLWNLSKIQKDFVIDLFELVKKGWLLAILFYSQPILYFMTLFSYPKGFEAHFSSTGR